MSIREIGQYINPNGVEKTICYDNDRDTYFVKCFYRGESIVLQLGENSSAKSNFPFTVFDPRILKRYGINTACGKFTYWGYKGLTCDPEFFTLDRSIYWDEAMGAHEKEDIFLCPRCSKKWHIAETYDSHKGGYSSCFEWKDELSYRDKLFELFQWGVDRYFNELFEKHKFENKSLFENEAFRISKSYGLNGNKMEILLEADPLNFKNSLAVKLNTANKKFDLFEEKSKHYSKVIPFYNAHLVVLISSIHSMARDFEEILLPYCDDENNRR
jgi:hypothetical protein